jgi:hypothetical protein
MVRGVAFGKLKRDERGGPVLGGTRYLNLPEGVVRGLKVFISHSSKGDSYAADVRDLVVASLLPDDKPLVDTDGLAPGDEWRAVLYHWLAMCDAAVILFNRKALKSPWVRREVNILLWRHALCPSFRVVPALLGDVARNDLEDNGFDDVTGLQLARTTEQAETPAAAEELAAAIARSLPPRGQQTDDPMANWVLDVADCLSLTEPQLSHHLDKAARVLGIEDRDVPTDWVPGERRRLVAAQLLGHELLGGGTGGSRLGKAAATVAPAFGSVSPLRRFVKAVTPSWVNGEAARHLVPLEKQDEPVDGGAPRPANRRVLILNATSGDIADQYVYRATFNALWGFQQIHATCEAAGAGGAEELTAHFEKVLRDYLQTEDWPVGKDLPHDEETTYYLMVQTGQKTLDTVATAVDEIQRLHPWLVVVLMVGPSAPAKADLESAGLGEATTLIPLLTPEAEIRARQLVESLEKIPKRLFGVSYGS